MKLTDTISSRIAKRKARNEERRRRRRRNIEYKRLKRVRKYSSPAYRHCKNCGSELHGMYCSNCGQYALDSNQTLGKMIGQFLENTYQIDGRLFQTLKFLIIRPGFLSNEFIAGKIRSYVHPIKLFLFISMLFFGFVLITSTGDHKFNNKVAGVEIKESKQRQIADSQRKIDSVRQACAKELSPTELAILDKTKGFTDFQLEQARKAASYPDSANIVDNPLGGILIGNSQLTKREQSLIMNDIIAQLTKYAPFIILLLMPLYAALARLICRKKRSKYIDSFIFSVHNHSAFLLMLGIILMLGMTGWDGFGTIFFVLFTLYHIFAMRRFYNYGWSGSILRTISIMSIYTVVVFIVFVMMIAVEALVIDKKYNLHLLE